MFFTPLVYASGYLVLVFLAICMVWSCPCAVAMVARCKRGAWRVRGPTGTLTREPASNESPGRRGRPSVGACIDPRAPAPGLPWPCCKPSAPALCAQCCRA